MPNLYLIYDKVKEAYIFSTLASTDAEAIRDLTKLFVSTIPLKDLDVFKIDYHDDDSKLVPWDTYAFPENKAQALEPLGSNIQQIVNNNGV